MINALTKKAQELGFIAVGFSRPDTPPYFDRFTAWLSDMKHADMTWLERNREVRADPTRLLKGCKAVLSLAFPYPSNKVGTPDGYTVSRYAQPTSEDYHTRLRRRCRELIGIIEAYDRGSRSRVCVDSAPILEKGLASAAGIGFIGKNNMLIIPGYGSYFYLAEILTTHEIVWKVPETVDNQCGGCTRCIDACPMGALEEPFLLNAGKCLSYLTIEYKGPLKHEAAHLMGDCFFGCDRCQEACPFNKEQGPTKVLLPATDSLLRMDECLFQEKFGNTTLARAGIEKIKANIRAVKNLR